MFYMNQISFVFGLEEPRHYCGTLLVSYPIDPINWQINISTCNPISVLRGINCSH